MRFQLANVWFTTPHVVRGWFRPEELRQAAPAFGLAHMLDALPSLTD